ncbi:hypothetical protein F4V57_02160 [Acinetobacter qingfengensis]|uniref:Uncharacterized protein n=1 Tax=Acinetobacter qingfengensis TaxID=1262585 RepID=A0A1E7RF97_9GAMM|nr:hypothetical protein [Acinetobacter qingfengensis]KAA8735617.1 hypothetical protein F4V57_02160 [Acinetobacter qingfengensis]OEY97932.1 hypothetical protein BJI46_07655 [Acinetobacter qingfengensis]
MIKTKQKIQPDWWTKTFAGLILGLSLSIAIGSLISIVSMGHFDRMLVPQLGMWAIPWLWMIVFFAAYFFQKGWHAVLCYFILNIITFSCVFLLRG